MNSLGLIQSICKYNASAPPVGSASVTSISGNYTLNASQFTISGYSVYKFYNTTAQPTTNASATNQTGSFTITISNATTTVYYLIAGGGSGGGSGDQGGGGGGSGNLIYGSVALPVGTYNCTYQVGGAGGGSNYVSSSNTFSNGANGYGCMGGDSNFVCNSTTYTSGGGGTGGPAYYSNVNTGKACSGGAGCSIGNGTLTAPSGSVHTGGNSVSNSYDCGAGGGASPYENGTAGSGGNSNAGHAGAGGIGGRATRSVDMSTPWTGFSATQYFCEGGSGACARTAIGSDTITPITSYYGYGGRGSGVPDSSPTNRCTSAVSDTTNGGYGSAGGGAFQAMGVGSGYYAGAGVNGVFLLAFA
jgi:hypothetical protein